MKPSTACSLAGLCAAALLTAGAAAQTPNPGEHPSPSQLLDVPVGGTQVPAEARQPGLRNPYEGDPRALAQGRKLFTAMNCIGCHAPQGGGGMGPPLSDSTWIYGSEPAQIYLTIVQGRPNGMPSFAKALPPDQVWQLVTYVRTLSKSPEKPRPGSRP